MAYSLHQRQAVKADEYFSIAIPAIACSFPCAIHPDAPDLIKVSDAWLLDRCKPVAAVCPQSKLAAKLFAADHLVTSAFGLLALLCFANAMSTQRLLSILKLMNWYFMLDNWMDEPGIWPDADPPAKSAHILNRIARIFVPSTPTRREGKLVPAGFSPLSLPGHDHDSPTASTFPEGSLSSISLEHAEKPAADLLLQPSTASCCSNGSTASSLESQLYVTQELARILTTTAAEWWSDMCVDMPLSQQLRFCKVFRAYLSCVLKESPFRSVNMLPDLNIYLDIRRHTIGWYPLALLTEYTLCMELDQDTITNPLLVALMDSACEAVAIHNDIMSFRKEYERGDHFNIVMVLCYQKLKERRGSCTGSGSAAVLPNTWAVELATPELLQESMKDACEMARQRDERCVCGTEKIKESRELMQKPGMGAFLEAIGNLVSGNLYWSICTGRYGVCTTGDSYKPALEQLERAKAIGVPPRTLHLRRPAQPVM